MAKLRKMLGDVNDATILSLMNMIETQSAKTLMTWALSQLEIVVSIYHQHQEDDRVDVLINSVRECLEDKKTVKELKQEMKFTREWIKDVEQNPIALAALRAITTACAISYTPTSALGYTFYYVAAVVYDRLGLDQTPQVYDAEAKKEFIKLLQSLEKVMVKDESNPVKVKWNC